jgi:hypothetical protein
MKVTVGPTQYIRKPNILQESGCYKKDLEKSVHSLVERKAYL